MAETDGAAIVVGVTVVGADRAVCDDIGERRERTAPLMPRAMTTAPAAQNHRRR
jgi:hypothetical protein